jgi:hypothetical protein
MDHKITIRGPIVSTKKTYKNSLKFNKISLCYHEVFFVAIVVYLNHARLNLAL